jgi:hypothetical protein
MWKALLGHFLRANALVCPGDVGIDVPLHPRVENVIDTDENDLELTDRVTHQADYYAAQETDHYPMHMADLPVTQEEGNRFSVFDVEPRPARDRCPDIVLPIFIVIIVFLFMVNR